MEPETMQVNKQCAELNTALDEHLTSTSFVERRNKVRTKTRKQYNPFEYVSASETAPSPIMRFVLTLYEVFKGILGLVVVPAKFAISLFLTFIAYLVAKVIVIGWDGKFPLSCWRETGLKFNAIIARMVLGLLYGFYYIPTIGKLCHPSEARILCTSPHVSIADALVSLAFLNFPGGISKAENQHLPLVGPIMRPTAMLFVNRSSREAKDEAVELLKQRANDPNSRHLMVFPDGTCHDPRSLIAFKRGAFAGGAPLQPIVLHYKYRFFNPTWSAGGPNRLFMAFRLASQFYNRVTVEFLPVYHPNEEEKQNPTVFADNVRKLVAERLDIQVTDHSYEDMFLAKASRKTKLPISQALSFEVYEVEQLFAAKFKLIKENILGLYTQERQFNKKTGKMNMEQFAKTLGLPLTEPLIEVFDTIAKAGDDGSDSNDGTGLSLEIDFPAFLLASLGMMEGIRSIGEGANTDNTADAVNTDNTDNDDNALNADADADVDVDVDADVDVEKGKSNSSELTKNILEKMFEAIDVNKNGKITESDLETALKKVFKKHHRRSAKHLFKLAKPQHKKNPDADGKSADVDFVQFSQFMKTYPVYLYLACVIASKYYASENKNASMHDPIPSITKKRLKALQNERNGQLATAS